MHAFSTSITLYLNRHNSLFKGDRKLCSSWVSTSSPLLLPRRRGPSSTGLWGTGNLHLYSSKQMNEKYHYCRVILGFLMFCLNAVLVQKAVFPKSKTTTFVFVGGSLKFWWECKLLTQRAEEGISFQNVVIWNQFWDFRGKEERQLFFLTEQLE